MRERRDMPTCILNNNAKTINMGGPLCKNIQTKMELVDGLADGQSDS